MILNNGNKGKRGRSFCCLPQRNQQSVTAAKVRTPDGISPTVDTGVKQKVHVSMDHSIAKNRKLLSSMTNT